MTQADWVTEGPHYIQLGALRIDGPLDGPLVVLGPNGSGKTRSTRNAHIIREIPDPVNGNPNPSLDQWIRAEYINANRWANVDDMQPTRVADATQQYSAGREIAGDNFLRPTNEANAMALRLAAERSAANESFVRELKASTPAGESPSLPITTLDELENIWIELFPGRRLQIEDWTPQVSWSTGSEPTTFPLNQMSDGEKMAFLLIGRVLTADSPLVIVDEPELHLHPELSTRIWNRLEDRRPDIVFVYITHSLSFAASRRSAQLVLCRSGSTLERVDVASGIPEDVAMDLMGSATLSVFATRVVFIEGESSSFDADLYRAWFRGHETVVKPVGSCSQVLQCVVGTTNSSLTSGLRPHGLIDFDFRPAGWTPDNVTVLPFHEIESLLAHPDLVEVVVGHLGRAFDRVEYEERLRTRVTPDLRRRVTLERWKQGLEWQMNRVLEPIRPTQVADISDTQREIERIFDAANWPFDPSALLDEEIARVEGAFLGTMDELLKYFPGKDLLPAVQGTTQLRPDGYVNLICRALEAGTGEPLTNLGLRLQEVLSDWLPSRSL